MYFIKALKILSECFNKNKDILNGIELISEFR